MSKANTESASYYAADIEFVVWWGMTPAQRGHAHRGRAIMLAPPRWFKAGGTSRLEAVAVPGLIFWPQRQRHWVKSLRGAR